MLLGDSLRLNQIILNLISNAVKFTHNGTVLLSVKLLNEDKENVTIEFTVTDSGIGIPADKITSIFNVLNRLNAAQRILWRNRIGACYC
jgi:signal transduction histidine kinase